MNGGGMSSQVKPEVAFILSLVGGILMVVGGAVSYLWHISGGLGFGGMMGGFGGMMGGYQGMMGSMGVPFGFMGWLSLIGFIAGKVVILSAFLLYVRPAEHVAWGVIILIFSLISLLGTGGFLIGAILGIIGGALALSWKPAFRV